MQNLSHFFLNTSHTHTHTHTRCHVCVFPPLSRRLAVTEGALERRVEFGERERDEPLRAWREREREIKREIKRDQERDQEREREGEL